MIRELGRGGFGVVWLCRRRKQGLESIEDMVAVKRLIAADGSADEAPKITSVSIDPLRVSHKDPVLVTLGFADDEGDVAGVNFGLAADDVHYVLAFDDAAGETAGVLLLVLLFMVAVIAAGAVILLVAGYILPLLLDVDMAPYHVEALVFHVAVNAAFYGMLAAAIGAWTGKAKMASGIAVAVMVVSYLAYGILPLIEGTETLQKFFPWYYFAQGVPTTNGVDWGGIAVLGGLSVVLLVIAVVGVNRRDLRSRNIGASLIDRLREHPLTRKVAERIAGSARVSRIAMKTASTGRSVNSAVFTFRRRTPVTASSPRTSSTTLSQTSWIFSCLITRSPMILLARSSSRR